MAFNTSHFSRMPQSRKPHIRFNRPFTHAGTMEHGQIIPVYAKLVAPGDIINETIIGNIRMSTPIAPLYSSIKASFNAFFVPLRLIWKNVKLFFGENDQTYGPQTTTYYVPSAYLNISDVTTSQVGQRSVSHYLGKPLYKGSTIDSMTDANKKDGNKVSILKERAYWCVLNEWYRAQQVSNPLFVADDDTDAIAFNKHLNSLPANCLKDFDYFTTCTTSPTYSATQVSMPLGTVAPVIASGSFLHDMTQSGRSVVRFGFDNIPIPAGKSTALYVDNDASGTISEGIVKGHGVSADAVSSQNILESSNLFADLTNAARADIEQLYLALAAEAWYHNANYGSRYFEMLQIHYGVTNPDLVLQRPEHLGEKKIYLAMQQVLSTAGAAADATTKLGQPGANSSTDFKFNIFNKSFGEWGIVLVLLNTYHEHYYTAGIEREDCYSELFDFYFPEFANIGDQKVMKKELFYASGSGDSNDLAFGYQEAWAEMRYSNNRLSGILDPYSEAGVNGSNNPLVGWTLSEKWSSVPSFNSAFMHENRDAIADALVSGQNGPDYIFYLYFDEKATRELPLYSVPGLPGRGRGII